MIYSTKNTLDSERNSPGFSHSKIIPYSDDDLDRFQRERIAFINLLCNCAMLVSRQKVIDIWKKMRENGNSKDGIVTKERFRQIFLEDFKNINIKDSLVNDVFESKYCNCIWS